MRLVGGLCGRMVCGVSLLCCLFAFRGSASAVELSPSKSTDKPSVDSVTKNVPGSSERYFALFGSYQAADKSVKSSHTFAVFFRASASERPGEIRVAENRTISWLPVSNDVGLTRPTEPGVNHSLPETISIADEHGYEVTIEGTHEIDAELYRRAVAQVERLSRGELQYKCMDRYTRDKAKNCMHAISDLVEENGRLTTFTQRGREATLMVVNHLRPHFVGTGEVPPGIADSLFAAVNLSRFRNASTEQGIAGVGGKASR